MGNYWIISCSLRAKNILFLKVLGVGVFAFSGTLISTQSGSRIEGWFKWPPSSRMLALIAINGWGIWWLMVLGYFFYQLLVLGDVNFTQDKTYYLLLIMFLGLPFSWVGYKFFGFLKYLESWNCEDLRNFFSRITK